MAERRKLLIADPDLDAARSLRAGLKDEYDVRIAKDGSRALELSILEYPDLILFYRHCPLIGATQFLRILRTNPRTEETPLIILADEQVATEVTPGFLEGILVKPLNIDEVRAHLAGVFRKLDTAKQVVEEKGEVKGSLEQISMADLLQIFSVNRRSGCLQLSAGPDGETAQVYLRDGRIEDAAAGLARGEKALYRLLSWSGGRFSFAAGQVAGTVTVNASTDSLLMEGMRQCDELERLRAELPGTGAVLERVVPPDGLPEGLHPVTAETYKIVEYYPRLSDLMDRAAGTDLEVGVAIRGLLDANLLRVSLPAAAATDTVLLTQEEVLGLRSRLRRAGLPPAFLGAPRVAVVAADPAELRALGVALGRLAGFTAGDLEQLTQVGVGTLGTLRLDAGTQVDFFAVANDERLLPLAYGLSAGTVAGLVLGTSRTEELEPALAMLERERRAALLVVRRPDEPAMDPASSRTVVDVDELSDGATRDVLRTLLGEVAGSDLRGVSV